MEDPKNWIEFECEQCHQQTRMRLLYYNRRKHHFCNKECYAKHMQILRLGKNNPAWKGGIRKSKGNVKIWRDGIKIKESRFVMEQKLGRKLLPKEQVHHLNKNPADNRPENLVVCKDYKEHARKYHPYIVKRMAEGRKRYCDDNKKEGTSVDRDY
jgi:hypothetical protein